MEEIRESQINFAKNEFDYEEEWNDNWSNKQFSETKNFTDTSRGNLRDTYDAATIITTLSDEADSVKSLKLKDEEETKLSKLKETSLKEAEIRFSDLYKFYPVPKDPGLNSAFWILYPDPPIYKPDGVEKFFDYIKVLNLTPIEFLRKQLKSDKVNLKYYCTDSKVIQSLIEVLITNVTVKTLDLQENHLTTDSCYQLNRLLFHSTVLRTLNLMACKIGKNGAMKLQEGLSNSSALRELNLSNCELGKEGLHYIVNAVTANTLLQNLNISNNNLDHNSIIHIEKLITQTQSLITLNLSWNNFYTKEASEVIFKSLIENVTILDIDLSWNSLGKNSFPYISQFISSSQHIKRLNLTANRFTDVEGVKIAQALLTNRCLEELLLNKNPLGSKGVSKFIQVLNSHEFMHCPLLILDFEHLWATKDDIPVLEKLQQAKPNCKIKIGGILGNYKIIGPNLKELFFKTANHEAMSCKKAKDRKNFGFFILSLEDSIISKAKFMALLNEAKINISENLAKEIMNQFLVTKKTVDQSAMKESYKLLFPDIKLPIVPSSTETADKSKKKKKSKGKRKKLKRKKKGKKMRSKRKIKEKIKKKKK